MYISEYSIIAITLVVTVGMLFLTINGYIV